MRTLLLMRHAKSDWEAEYGLDHDRPLNKRGTRSAELMGRVLTARGLAPEFIVSSTAVRARTTAELAMKAGRWEAGLRLDRVLYESGPQGVLETAATAPEVNRLMLVGHQPTWSMLAKRLTGEPVEMKTATVAMIELELESWSGLPGATGALAGLLNPSSFDGSEWDREP